VSVQYSREVLGRDRVNVRKSTRRGWRLRSLIPIGLLAAVGCGGNEETTSVQAAGALSFGGQSQMSQTSHSGGAGISGAGGTASGGTVGSGGSSPTGIVATTSAGVTGGAPSGGATHSASTGGATIAATGGTSATGGTVSYGGVTTTGGTSFHPTGGGPTSVTSGGTATGGTPATGGKLPTGGAPSTSTSITTGGTMATGGSGGAGTGPTWPKKFCGNITTGNTADPSGLSFVKYWDQLTPENQGKWMAVQSSPTAAFNWSSLDSLYAYTEQSNIPFKEHSFVTGGVQPSGVYTAALVENWIKSFCQRYPKTALIDVVNEPPPHTTPSYASALGEGESGIYPWIVKSFKWARLYCGNAVLILNDYDNLAYPSSQAHFIDIVKDIRANGAPIDAVGAEAHDASTMTASALQTSLETLGSQTGLPIYITEYDVSKSSDAEQLST